MPLSLLYPAKLSVIRKYRSDLQNDNTLLVPNEFGAGSVKGSTGTISSSAKRVSVHPVFGMLLYRIVQRYRPQEIIELGTAFGISTMYLAAGNPSARVITVEANPQLASRASSAFENGNFKNITVINKSFEDSIQALIPHISSRTLVFIDGNHTGEATLQYFAIFNGAGILIFDDIRWSEGMKIAWRVIRKSPHCRRVIDLYRMGIVYSGQ